MENIRAISASREFEYCPLRHVDTGEIAISISLPNMRPVEQPAIRLINRTVVAHPCGSTLALCLKRQKHSLKISGHSSDDLSKCEK